MIASLASSASLASLGKNDMIKGYKELIVWQKSIRLSVALYKLTKKFPREDIYGLTSQMRRSAVSIPSNIAEGRMRGTRKDFLSFLRIAYGSGAELETQIEIAENIYASEHLDFSEINTLLLEIMKMLNAMIRKMNPNITSSEANEAKS
jgi:four helix bundle protein